MSLTVKNNQRVSFVLQLPLDFKVDEELFPHLVPTDFSMETTVLPTDGQEGGTRLVEKKIPQALTWLPGEERADLPEGLGELFDFKRALNQRKLSVIQAKSPQKSAGPPTPSTTATPSTPPMKPSTSGDKK